MKTIIDELLENMSDIIDAKVEQYIKSYEDSGNTVTEHFIEMTRLGLIIDLVKAIGKYTKKDDKLVDYHVTGTPKGKFTVIIGIERDGQKYYLSTNAITAGGYIQCLHYRYLVDTNLPKTDNVFIKAYEEKVKKLNKIERLNKELELNENWLRKTLDGIETSKKMTDDEIIAESWLSKFMDITWAVILERGVEKNYDYSEENFNAKRKQDIADVLESHKRTIDASKGRIKGLMKNIEKIKAKIEKEKA